MLRKTKLMKTIPLYTIISLNSSMNRGYFYGNDNNVTNIEMLNLNLRYNPVFQ